MKTAVEWLFEQYVETAGIISTEDIKQALEMEKQQMVDIAYDYYASLENKDAVIIIKLPEELYKQTYESSNLERL
jgi:transaldolase